MRVDLSLNVRRVFSQHLIVANLNESYEKVSQIYDHLVKRKNLLKTNLENGNPEVHPGPTLLNVGRIDYGKFLTL